MSFRCDTPGLTAENRREYDTEAEALAAAEVLIRGGARHVVIWSPDGGSDVAQAAEDRSCAPNSPEAATGVVGLLRGLQSRLSKESA